MIQIKATCLVTRTHGEEGGICHRSQMKGRIMTANVGTIDRVIRIVAGLALLAWALGYIPGFAPSLWGWIGVVPLATGLVGTCPIYRLLGMDTCSRSDRSV